MISAIEARSISMSAYEAKRAAAFAKVDEDIRKAEDAIRNAAADGKFVIYFSFPRIIELPEADQDLYIRNCFRDWGYEIARPGDCYRIGWGN